MITNYLQILLTMAVTSAFTGSPLVIYSQLLQRNILSKTVAIRLPSNFTQMNNYALSIKYPKNNKPSEAYTNSDATVNIAFNRTEESLTDSKVNSEGKKLQNQLVSNGGVELITSKLINPQS